MGSSSASYGAIESARRPPVTHPHSTGAPKGTFLLLAIRGHFYFALTGDDRRLAAAHDFGGVGVEHAVVVRLSVLGEGLMNGGIRLESGGLQTRFNHAEAAERENCPLERLVGLKADDHLVVAIDITCFVCEES